MIEIVDLRAISVLEGLYIEHENDLRWVLDLAATAAGIAAEAGSERVDDTHVFEAQKSTPR